MGICLAVSRERHCKVHPTNFCITSLPSELDFFCSWACGESIMYFINDIICTWSGRQNEREVYLPAQDREGMEFLLEFPPICKKKGVDGYFRELPFSHKDLAYFCGCDSSFGLRTMSRSLEASSALPRFDAVKEGRKSLFTQPMIKCTFSVHLYSLTVSQLTSLCLL